MEKIFKICLFALTVIFYLGSIAYGEKRMDIISMSNGYPSGAHFNLNIHGKDSTYSCDNTVGGNSVFINEYGTSTIEYISNRKAIIAELTVLDACAELFDGDAAQVQLPYEQEGYYVFARLRGKPNNSLTPGDPSNVLLVPNPVLKVCNNTDPANPDFPNYTECYDGSLLTLGLVTNEGVYKITQKGLFRFEPTKTKGKGKATAQDITGLFIWTGYVLQASLDTNGPEGVPDGVIDIYDVPTGYDGDGDGDTDEADLNLWMDEQVGAGLGTYYENSYIWDIADLVIQEQTITNDGAKLLKIRFYPVSTTSFFPNYTN